MDGLAEVPDWYTQRSTRQSNILEHQRNRTAIAMLAQVIEMQTKDVPILVTAFEYRDHQPTVLTNDESFAEFDHPHTGCQISVEYVP